MRVAVAFGSHWCLSVCLCTVVVDDVRGVDDDDDEIDGIDYEERL